MRLAFVTSHPIQYQAPLFRRLAATAGVSLDVFFCHNHGVRPSLDRGFGRAIQYDVPLLGGYRHHFLRNVAPHPAVGFRGQWNPTVLTEVLRGPFDAVVVHGYATPTTLAALATPRSSRGPRVLLRGESHLDEPRPLHRRLAKAPLLRWLFARVDHFLPIGALNRAYFEAYGVPLSRMTLAPYTVDNDYFAERAAPALADRRAARAALGLPVDATLFLFCAKLAPWKRPLDAVAALAEAHRRAAAAGGDAWRGGAPAHLVIAGDGAQRAEVEAAVAAAGLERAVTRLGFRNQSELPALYAACDALVLPSETEPWGLVVNEAMACGAAILASRRVGSAADLVGPDNGAVFEAGDVGALARAFHAWSLDPAALERRRAASRRRIARWGLAETVDGILRGAEAARAARGDAPGQRATADVAWAPPPPPPR